MTIGPELVPVDTLLPLVDTKSADPTHMSCVATALRDVREFVGRRPHDGKLAAPEHGATWAGALVYMIYCEQIGACFRPKNHPHLRRRGKALSDALGLEFRYDPDQRLVHARQYLSKAWGYQRVGGGTSTSTTRRVVLARMDLALSTAGR